MAKALTFDKVTVSGFDKYVAPVSLSQLCERIPENLIQLVFRYCRSETDILQPKLALFPDVERRYKLPDP